jgi:hypothetical protein
MLLTTVVERLSGKNCYLQQWLRGKSVIIESLLTVVEGVRNVTYSSSVVRNVTYSSGEANVTYSSGGGKNFYSL